jgi:hypothetical protein
MPNVVVRYQTKPDRADENQRYVEKVFAELVERQPAGFRYMTLRLEDRTSFVHILFETGEGGDSLAEVPAFKEFVAGIAERCVEQPVATGATVVGSYRISTD